MRRFFRTRIGKLGALVGLGGFVGIGALAVLAVFPAFGEIPDAGVLEPVRAPPLEEFRMEVLAPGATFGAMLRDAGLTTTEQHNLLLAFREHANPARLREGTEVTFRWLRADGALRRVDVATSRDELIRLQREGLEGLGWLSSRVETPVQTDTVFVGGEITRDLWSSVVHNAALEHMPQQDRAQLLHLLDRVFQWQLDFSRQIRAGDSYRMVFQREVRPDGSMRSGRILAAELVNLDRPLYAIWFDLHEDGQGGYYDLEGESLRRAFLRAPLEYRRISSRFNRNRMHPILNQRRPHIGVDYAAATGTPVMATADGVVTRRRWDGGYGNLVEIRHANGYMTRYAHLTRFAQSIREGGRVSQGQVVGFVGMTGLATGPHLHYEMHRHGSPVNPLTVDIPAGDPIPDEARDRWTEALATRVVLLDGIESPAGVRIVQSDDEEESDDGGDGPLPALGSR
jgi:murein DD-endopeptidase MepM/ murein hydrolase activator NlpD